MMVFLLDVHTHMFADCGAVLWGRHRTFLMTLAGTGAYDTLGQRSQGTCIKCAVQHYDVSCDVVSIIGI